MKATRNAEPVLHVVGQLGSRRPVTRLAESHVLYQVIRVHEEGAPVNQDREVIGRVVIQFWETVICSLPSMPIGGREGRVDHGDVVRKEGLASCV